MPDLETIFNTQAEQYDRLVACEDSQGLLWPALCRILSFDGLDVVELGAGTGRLSLMMVRRVERLWAFDLSSHMLVEAQKKLIATGMGNWHLTIADNRWLPVSNGVADVAISAWSVGILNARRYPSTWRNQVGYVIAEMMRVLRPGGVIILIETLGTGEETPKPPHDALSAYYEMLEQEFGFASSWVRTDYHFPSRSEAVARTRFFFGDELAARIAARNSAIVPECTGIWWLEV